MDIQHLVDKLEDLIDEGRHVWLTKLTLIDEERALEMIDQMRISVPEEIDKANRILNQRDRLLAQANEESARIVELAKEKSEQLIQRDSITQAAQARAANIIEQARREAEGIRTDADNYVLDVLREFETHLAKTMTIVRNGINKITQDMAISRGTAVSTPAEPAPSAQPEPLPSKTEVKAEIKQAVDVPNNA
jgi:F0F1-type ATP synthase membrane subunit b/b'